jgi:protein-S-isoprenylcysteine O-methyltransferase Ste14
MGQRCVGAVVVMSDAFTLAIVVMCGTITFVVVLICAALLLIAGNSFMSDNSAERITPMVSKGFWRGVNHMSNKFSML